MGWYMIVAGCGDEESGSPRGCYVDEKPQAESVNGEHECP